MHILYKCGKLSFSAEETASQNCLLSTFVGEKSENKFRLCLATSISSTRSSLRYSAQNRSGNRFFLQIFTTHVAVSCESGYWKFEKWKWKKFSFTFCSRSEKWNENLIHSFREWKVKYKCLEIEIESEKWNENALRSRSRVKSEMKMPRDREREVKFLENSREILEN